MPESKIKNKFEKELCRAERNWVIFNEYLKWKIPKSGGWKKGDVKDWMKLNKTKKFLKALPHGPDILLISRRLK